MAKSDPPMNKLDVPTLTFTTDAQEIIVLSDWPPDMALACTVLTQETQEREWLLPIITEERK